MAQVADDLRESAQLADWSNVRGLYCQYRDLVADRAENHLLIETFASLSKSLSEVAPSYWREISQFSRHALAIFADVDGREKLDTGTFHACYRAGTIRCLEASHGVARRVPAPYEAVVESCRRLRDFGLLREELRDVVQASILCGSVSYGPFYSVRGNYGGDLASDLDVVLIVAEDSDLSSIVDGLAALPGIEDSHVGVFDRRASTFMAKYDDERTMLSHKFAMWSSSVRDPLLDRTSIRPNYDLSLHVLRQSVLKYALVESSPQLRISASGRSRTILDYRERSTSRLEDLRTFAGCRPLRIPRLRSRKAIEGMLRPTFAYYIDDRGGYCPGFMHRILMPRLDGHWISPQVRDQLTQFKIKFAERLGYERSRDRFRDLRPSFAHVRRDVFAPHVVRALDTEYSPS